MAIVTIVSIVALRVWRGYHETYSSAVQSQTDLAELLEASTTSIFQSVDLILDREAAGSPSRGDPIGVARSADPDREAFHS